MALSWTEIKDRATRFSKEWKDEFNESAESQTFINQFFDVFGINRRRVASFETRAKKIDGRDGYIDMLWKGVLLIEQKSKGQSLDKAFTQAKDYFPGIKDADLPKYILISDFAKFRLYDLEENTSHEFELKDFYKNIKLFGFIAGYKKQTYKPEDPVNIEAAELMGKLHDRLKEIGYDGHELEVYLVRLLFCLFAEDTSIFEKKLFQEFIEQKTKDDGSDLAGNLSTLFDILNTPPEKRLTNTDESLLAFPYVNGKLFEERLRTASFDKKMRQTLLDCCYLDWSKISPAIFGSLFQSVMNPDERRNLGAHYTSEKNILKLIKPLFLDDLYKEFESVKNNRSKLNEFHTKLSTLHFLDPACGCGNFLVITYRELRLLELEILRQLFKSSQLESDIQVIMKVDVDQFWGIEYEEFPARIAEVAMWLVDHQMNMLISEEFGQYVVRLPLKKSAQIIHGNALRLDWLKLKIPPFKGGVANATEDVEQPTFNFILGNPPFIGHHLQTKSQKADLHFVLHDIQAAGVMDYVTAWYYKASDYLDKSNISDAIKVGFVSTNSITQGEQVGILWSVLISKFHIKIHFAHRTFKWSNEARGVAAVYCVIIGFSNFDISEKRLYEYETVKSEPHELIVKNINPYLVDYRDILIGNQTNPICDVPKMQYGSKPSDGGFFLFSEEEKTNLLLKEPKAKKFLHRYISGREFLYNENRYCLWLVNAKPDELRELPEVMKRIQAVKEFRNNSKAESTRKYQHHTLFRQVTQPDSEYIIFPSTGVVTFLCSLS